MICHTAAIDLTVLGPNLRGTCVRRLNSSSTWGCCLWDVDGLFDPFVVGGCADDVGADGVGANGVADGVGADGVGADGVADGVGADGSAPAAVEEYAKAK